MNVGRLSTATRTVPRSSSARPGDASFVVLPLQHSKPSRTFHELRASVGSR